MTELRQQVPVTLLTGYLGAGKTTLLNRVLSNVSGKKYAVIVNEFGEIGIDNGLIVASDEEVIELNNGCVCCSVRGDLVRIVGGLIRRSDRFDGILVETTGLADPAPVAQTFFVDNDIRRFTKLDAIVTVVDAMHVLSEIEHASEIEEQVAFADVIVLNKCDLVLPPHLEAAAQKIREINPYAVFHQTRRCDLDVNAVLGRYAFSLDRILDVEPEFLNFRHHHHDDGIGRLSLAADAPLNSDRFFLWIHDTVQRFGPQILRMKGVLSLRDDDDRFVVQSVHMLMEGDRQRPWKLHEKRTSRLVFIGRDVPEGILRQGFEACCG